MYYNGGIPWMRGGPFERRIIVRAMISTTIMAASEVSIQWSRNTRRPSIAVRAQASILVPLL